MNLVLLGAPGAGKGTQSDKIVSEFGVEHVTTGDALRANKQMNISHLDLEYDTPGEYMDKGELVPDEVVNEIVEKALDEADGYVLDGYPRNRSQAEFLDTITDLDVVLYLDVDEDVLVERLTGRRVCEECGAPYHVEFNPPEEEGVCDECGGDLYQREDDSEETARERIQNQDPELVVNYYHGQDGFVRIDGEQPPEAVWNDILRALKER